MSREGSGVARRVGRSLVAAAFVSAACADVAGIGGDYYVGGGGSAGSDGGGGSKQCESARAPAPPAVQDAGGDIELVFALKAIDFHEASQAEYESIGFDLDKTCTCQGEQASCARPADAPPDYECDGPGGRDNNSGGLIAASALLGLSSKSFNENIAQGEWSVLVRVRGYNGKKDDDQVSVSWLTALAIPLQFQPVKWDGTDQWPINAASFELDGQGKPDMEKPKSQDALAYVTGGRLVASLKGEAPVDIAANVSINLVNAFVMGELVENAGVWSVQGTVGGMWLVGDVLKAMRNMTPLGQPLCTDHPIYGEVKKTICSRRDISPTALLASEPCDAISLAFTFTAAPAKILGAFDVAAPANPCVGKDPGQDSCD